MSGKAQDKTLDAICVLTFKGRICIPRVGDLIHKLLKESLDSRNEDISEFMAKCHNCQQVKYDPQMPSGLLQRMPILEWKLEIIDTDFVVGIPKTVGKFDSIWLVVDRLIKSVNFIPVRIDYNAQQLAKVYVNIK
nr:uncharacterized protein LOC104646868 [Solanum lycopersicum]